VFTLYCIVIFPQYAEATAMSKSNILRLAYVACESASEQCIEGRTISLLLQVKDMLIAAGKQLLTIMDIDAITTPIGTFNAHDPPPNPDDSDDDEEDDE
jgi:hypothetical protein